LRIEREGERGGQCQAWGGRAQEAGIGPVALDGLDQDGVHLVDLARTQQLRQQVAPGVKALLRSESERLQQLLLARSVSARQPLLGHIGRLDTPSEHRDEGLVEPTDPRLHGRLKRARLLGLLEHAAQSLVEVGARRDRARARGTRESSRADERRPKRGHGLGGEREEQHDSVLDAGLWL